ncbi:MAG: hypothetical protein U0869_25280 [Chloroflexota bacterium]
MKRLAEEFKARGKLSSFEMSDANGDVPTQITQIQQFIDSGLRHHRDRGGLLDGPR